MRSRFVFWALAASACATSPGAPPVGRPSPALRAALDDTSSLSRVYMPQEVASPAHKKLDVSTTTTSVATRQRIELQQDGSLTGEVYENDKRRRGARSSIVDRTRTSAVRTKLPPGEARVRAIVEHTGWIDSGTVEIVSATNASLAKAMMKWTQSRFEPARDSTGRAVRQLVEIVVRDSWIGYTETLTR